MSSFGPNCRNYIVKHCKTHPFSVGIDGSNDTGFQKMNRVCLKIFYVNRNKKVTSHFFDMCLTSGVDGATAAAIFSVIDEKFESHGIPWEKSYQRFTGRKAKS